MTAVIVRLLDFDGEWGDLVRLLIWAEHWSRLLEYYGEWDGHFVCLTVFAERVTSSFDSGREDGRTTLSNSLIVSWNQFRNIEFGREWLG